MADTDHHRDDHTEKRSKSRTVTGRRVWSPAQVVAGAIGLFLVVLGAVVLLRNGFDSFTGTTVDVLGFEHTTAMGIVHIGIGLIFLGAASTLGGLGSLTFVSLAAVAFGLITIIEPGNMAEWVGGAPEIGWLYVAIGAVSMLVAWAAPTIVQRSTATKQGSDTRGTERTREAPATEDAPPASEDAPPAADDDAPASDDDAPASEDAPPASDDDR
jgi:hypothetical protein